MTYSCWKTTIRTLHKKQTYLTLKKLHLQQISNKSIQELKWFFLTKYTNKCECCVTKIIINIWDLQVSWMHAQKILMEDRYRHSWTENKHFGVFLCNQDVGL